MNKKFLTLLCDPQTKENLTLKITEAEGDNVLTGELISSNGQWPIIGGVPRFAGYTGPNYSKSFGWQWNKWPLIQFEAFNVGRPMAGWTKNMWEKITGVTENLSGKIIVDIGCGSGRFVDVANAKGATVIGVDYSRAVDFAGQYFKNNPNILIIQADALNLPIKSEVADGVFSIGVLHHTQNPALGFSEMCRTAKNKTWVGLSVYGVSGYYDSYVVKVYRKAFNLLWKIFGPYPALIYSYVVTYTLGIMIKIPVIRHLAVLLKKIFPFISLPDNRWTLLDTFDSLTPSNQSGHTHYEVFTWFNNNKIKEIQVSDWFGPAFHGKK